MPFTKEEGSTLIRCIKGASPRTERSLNFTPRLTLSDRLSLVILLLATSQSEVDLRQTSSDGESQRHQGISPLLQLAPQVIEFVLVDKQLAWPCGIVLVLSTRPGIGTDVHPDEPKLAIFDTGVGIPKIHSPRPNRLNLRPRELDTSLQLLLDEVVVIRFPVNRDDLFRFAALRLLAHAPIIPRRGAC